ncbi:hypothetical protein A3A64_03950 [Candidatus Gottesmanbacteria bacterium RIFCSPLOWO2_01_FULL_48_11]|uniref:AB hydrolase-1 domain-containing protein n=3 Tax=Patescibacteria group TaxID=1783273 RepID=A0A1F6AUS3_9BACT|nr:MAG: Hydrolase, alpha/beta fold family protein [Parcubacteria group bacterium GW2011_GWA2_46_10]KKU21428.1 MAG: Hydrolase, alpha/beta fold family protein [Candidatus Nomurabacteria bacterium GW2011_GWA1_46_11]OGG28429.1 MAG: hypothetical protein A3A64_03950 [Candidatus Gottesmanbacteria bacterium RIFCSPLOWO2_01_FULL_48_11]OGY56329.1 MAG: hypothetical protein A2119_02060 [Candidatus Colwellbacteria bacterium GWA2_46_10]
MLPLSQKQISIRGLLVNYYTRVGDNRQHKKTFIFLHGWRSSGTIWFAITSKITDANLCCMDFPGFGRSTLPQGVMDLNEYASIVRDFISKLGLTNITLVGHSFGGRVAIKLVSTNPELVSRLVLVDSAGFASSASRKAALGIVARMVRPLFRPAFMHSLRRKIYTLMGTEDYVATPELKDTFVKVVNEDLSDAMRTIKTQTLIVWGGQDKETPLAMGEKIHSLIPHSRLEVIKNAGHFSFLDNPSAFTNLLNNV